MYKKLKPIEELVFADDFMFGEIMKDEQTCRGVIERLLQIKIDHIEYPELQKCLSPLYSKKGVRLDVYVEGSDKIFDVECQTYAEKNIGKRTRYYQAMIDSDILLKGQSYSELKESFVLFLCLQDPFNAGLPVYSFDRTCKEDSNIRLQDETHHIFFNCNAFDKEHDSELKAFLDFVKNNKATTDFTRRIAKMVQSKKFEKTFINEYMAINLHEMDVEKRGIDKGRTEDAKAFLKLGIPMETVAKGTGLSIDYLKTLV